MEYDISIVRKLLSERTARIQTLELQAQNTKGHISAYRWWLGIVITETSLIIYFAEPLQRLPIPLWGLQVGTLICSLGMWVILQKRKDRNNLWL